MSTSLWGSIPHLTNCGDWNHPSPIHHSRDRCYMTYTLYNIYFTLITKHFTLHTKTFTPHTVQLHSHWAQHSVFYVLHTVDGTTSHCTLCFTHCTLYTESDTLHIAHFKLRQRTLLYTYKLKWFSPMQNRLIKFLAYLFWRVSYLIYIRCILKFGVTHYSTNLQEIH